MANPLPVIEWGTAAPTSTSTFYQAGTLIMNPAPAVSGIRGWVCTADGRPGTWVPQGHIDAGVMVSVSAASALAAGVKTHYIVNASTQTLASAASYALGAEVIIHGAGLVTLVAAANQTVTGASTVAAGSAYRFISNGVNTWLKSN